MSVFENTGKNAEHPLQPAASAVALPSAPLVIEPSIGRVVWFWPSKEYKESEGAQAYSAQICYVHSTRLVNIAGYDPNGVPFTRTSLQLRQPDDPAPKGEFVEWMPFQVNTASGK